MLCLRSWWLHFYYQRPPINLSLSLLWRTAGRLVQGIRLARPFLPWQMPWQGLSLSPILAAILHFQPCRGAG